LKKPAALDDEEYELVQKHAIWGDSLLRRLGFSSGVRRLVRGHHERLDGSGYPDGVTALSLETRVLAVCDVYDALRSERVYREAWTTSAPSSRPSSACSPPAAPPCPSPSSPADPDARLEHGFAPL